MPTLAVTGSQTVAAGQQLTFTNETGVSLQGTLTLDGTILVVDAPTNFTGGALSGLDGGGRAIIGATGVFRVAAMRTSGSGAYGFRGENNIVAGTSTSAPAIRWSWSASRLSSLPPGWIFVA